MEITRYSPPAPVADRFGELFAPHREGGEFFNPWLSRDRPRFTDLLKWQLSTNPWRAAKRSEEPVKPAYDGLEKFNRSDARAKILWMGHASFLIELDGFRCLIDPVYGTVGAFVRRFSPEPFPLRALPTLDAVLLTHGHYDHLDVQTLRAVAEQQPDVPFVVGIGQDSYLPRACKTVQTVDWWDAVDFGGVSGIFVPTQHWHRRGLLDYNAALWGGWILRGSRTILHAGDSGYFEQFAGLGELFEIDTAILPVGAYEPRWFMREQHMNPAEALDTMADLRAERMVAMHWGTYDLTDEPLNLGARVVMDLAADRGLADRVQVPMPGSWVEAR